MQTRRGSAIVSLLVNLVLLFALTIAPGWRALPFLTDQAEQVVPYVALSMAVAALGALLQLLVGADWIAGLTGAIGSAFALVASLALWRVFPFDVPDPWPIVLRILIGLGIFGAALGILSGLIGFVRGLLTPHRGSGGNRYGSTTPGPGASARS